jgi:uncharacterized protein with HEPN domain
VSLSPREYISHILDEIDYVLSQRPGQSFETFSRNETLKRAFVPSLEIIGEAAKKELEDFRDQQPGIQWRKVTGMLERLIRDYFGVDHKIVWDVATTKLSDLRNRFQALLNMPENRQQDAPADGEKQRL